MNFASAIEPLIKKVKVIHGASDGAFLLAGRTVGDVQAALSEPFGIPEEAIAFVNGERVELSHVLRSNDALEFIQAVGEKGILDPDEKAQMDRIEKLLLRLFGESAEPGSPGRSVETLEIAVYVNQLRQKMLTWKEVLRACRERWPEDNRHLRNVEQVRATFRRHFGKSKRNSD